MTRLGSIKETGEEVSDHGWRRFERAVGLDAADRSGKEREGAGEVQTDQPYREEAEDPGSAGSASKPGEADDPERRRDAGKTTRRTE